MGDTNDDSGGIGGEAAPASLDDPTHEFGTMVGPYQLTKLLGSGGMGRVFAAEHTVLGRKVALKMLRPQRIQDRDAVSRFFAEARAVNRCSHEHIIEITDFIEGEGVCAYVMELLEGESLADVIDRDAPLPVERIAAIGVQIASAVGAAHAAGIIHRDLKPENVFLTRREGRAEFVKLLDFGVAKLAPELQDESMSKTGAGVVLGTPEFMAPEQMFGRPLDARIDVYALGVILYAMASGALPFTAPSFGELAVKRATQQVPFLVRGDLGPLPQSLHDLIMSCLAMEPGDRPQTMRDVEIALDRHRARAKPRTTPSPPPAPAAAPTKPARRQQASLETVVVDRAVMPPPRTNRVVIVAAILGAVVIAIGLAAALIQRESRTETPAATTP